VIEPDAGNENISPLCNFEQTLDCQDRHDIGRADFGGGLFSKRPNSKEFGAFCFEKFYKRVSTTLLCHHRDVLHLVKRAILSRRPTGHAVSYLNSRRNYTALPHLSFCSSGMKSFAASVHCSSGGAVTYMLRHPRSKTCITVLTVKPQRANKPSRAQQRRPTATTPSHKSGVCHLVQSISGS
jgi:hypothetical protein